MKQALVIRTLVRIRMFHYIKKNIAKIRCLEAVSNILDTEENLKTLSVCNEIWRADQGGAI